MAARTDKLSIRTLGILLLLSVSIWTVPSIVTAQMQPWQQQWQQGEQAGSCPSLAHSQDWSQVYQGVVRDQLRSNGWFQDATRQLPQRARGGLGTLYNLYLINDMGQEGIRDESYEWFRNASQPFGKDAKSLLPK